MMHRYFIAILTGCIVLTSALPVQAFEFNPNYVIADSELVASDDMSLAQIQAFLDARGTLGTRTFPDVDGTEKDAAKIIYDASRRNGIGARVILVMLQKEQSLIEDTSPSDDQLDWAMGYGICDGCTYETGTAQRFRGFAKQINSATLQFSEGYLADLSKYGETVMGFGPGIAALIDEIDVVFANAATAALYTYTPHTHGNSNFARLWQQWFSREYPDGSLLQNKEDGGVWLIRDGSRRAITSRAALMTRFNENAIIPVDPTTIESYPTGVAITLPNYSLLRSPRGTVYLLVDDTLRGIASAEAFRAIGFNPDEIVDVTFEDLSLYQEGEPITSDTVYPQGALVQNTTTGGVYYVENGTKSPILSREILRARFPAPVIIPAADGELALYETAKPLTFPDGTLVSTVGLPDVFVISDGERRAIPDEDTFLSYGWNWTQVIETDAKSVAIHPIGAPLESTKESIDAHVESTSL